MGVFASIVTDEQVVDHSGQPSAGAREHYEEGCPGCPDVLPANAAFAHIPLSPQKAVKVGIYPQYCNGGQQNQAAISGSKWQGTQKGVSTTIPRLEALPTQCGKQQ